MFRAGIDIGSTTIKTVVLGKDNDVIFKSYKRHFSEITSALKENLAELKKIVTGEKFAFALTGSAGMGIGERLNLPFVQEVVACASAVKKLIPSTDTVVELGGEDAKIMYFGDAPEERMNGVCAGGTGSFIDHMASLLNTDAAGLNALAEKGDKIYTIASRCGVFAKTDVQALMNDGASKENIAKSILQAVVNQTVGNLAQGRPITGKVAFLGGPLHFLPELKKLFIKTLKLDAEHTINVENGNYFVAMGAALAGDAKITDMNEIESLVSRSDNGQKAAETNLSPLFSDEKDYEKFVARHAKYKVKRAKLKDYGGKVYLGIDAGSTTTKIVAISEDKEILYTDYGSNFGSPLTSVIEKIKKFYDVLPKNSKIGGAYTTGYGEAIVKAALHTDGGVVETFAHLRAAKEFCPEVTFVMDIGGQDMKCFFVKNGAIENITLNEACSAGCGSFIENFAESLSLTAGEFANLAKNSKAPVDLGTRCTVFMNSKVKQAQKDGADVADISAGIAVSVIKNALFKVLQLKNTEDLGDYIVVQGGTFYNDAVLAAMEDILQKEVIRPDIAGLMGAYGAAITALEAKIEKSSLLSKENLDNFKTVISSYRCNGCTNNCLITMQKFPDGGKYFTGNRCERGVGGEKKDKSENSAYAYKYKRVFDYKPLENPTRGEMGLLRVLNMYEDYPFWYTFFTKLGFKVILSEESTAKMYFQGMSTVPADSLCYPAKLVHGHTMNLINRGVKRIFYPCEPYNADNNESLSNHFNCPVVASYGENIRNNMDVLTEKGVEFIEPFLPIDDKKRMAARLYEVFKKDGITKKEIADATLAAYEERENYVNDVKNYGEKLLKKIDESGKPAILLVGQPYHIDPEINHGIADMISSYGLPILSEDSVCHLGSPPPANVANQWSYHGRMYRAASLLSEHKNLSLIHLFSFGCGIDAITSVELKEIVESGGGIYTMIKLDEVSNLGAAKIRLRSLLEAIKERKADTISVKRETSRPRFTEDKKYTHTILAPQMAPIHFELAETVMKKYGYKIAIPPMPDKSAIDLGLRYVNNDMCYPSIVVIGQLLAALKSGVYDTENTSIMLFQTCGACRATNYIATLRKALKAAGFKNVPVFAFYGRPEDTDDFTINRKFLVSVFKAGVYGDLLMNVKNRCLPYEIEKGSVQKLYDEWMEKAKAEILKGNYFKFRNNIKKIVNAFDNLPIREERKPQVGIVGEILVKYHPIANNKIEESIVKEGAEVVMPGLLDFFLYTAYDSVVNRLILSGSFKNKVLAKFFISMIEFFRRPMIKALKKSKRFHPPKSIGEMAKLASRHVSLGNMAGEGWFLTGEMVELIESGVKNIICLQPFACLPNHITGKGVMHALRKTYKDVNIAAIDCDAGASEVNQLNRLKLMLSIAKRNE